MYLGFTADQREIITATHELLDDCCTPNVIRNAWDGNFPATLWNQFAHMGLPLALVHEDHGGMGFSFVESTGILEEVGRFAVPAPIMETINVVAPVLEAAKEWELLNAIGAGDIVATASFDASGYLAYPDADIALILSGTHIELIELNKGSIVYERTIDGARPVGRIQSGGRTLDVDSTVIQRAWLGGILGTSCELLGLSEQMLRLTVDYVKTREQFGRPVGSFQSVKHRLANVLIEIETARPMVYAASWSLSENLTDSERDVVAARVAIAKAALNTARSCLHSHGGIGYTTEYDLSLWMKRSWALNASWGSASQHRERLSVLLGV